MAGVVLGLKLDLEVQRKIPKEKGQEFARANGFHYFEVSSKSEINIEGPFVTLAHHLFNIVNPHLWVDKH